MAKLISTRSTFCTPLVARPAIDPLKVSAASSTSVPDEIVIVLEHAVPPLTVSMVPPAMVALESVPPDETTSLPPDETSVSEATPPAETLIWSPDSTTPLLAKPPLLTIWKALAPETVVLR